MGSVVTKLRSGAAWWLAAIVWLASGTSAAEAQDAQQIVIDLNRQAMDAYNALDINKAGSMLEEALRVGYQGRVPPQLVARTSLNLGVVYIGGLNDQDHGLQYFMQALCTDPTAQLDPLMSSPDVQNVYSVALQRARGGACATGAPPAGGAPAPAPAPAVPAGPPPPPPPPPPNQAIAHRPPPEQLAQTPLPLYVEISPLAQAKEIIVNYMGLGMKEWKAVPMHRYQTGFAYQISCNEVWEPKVQYYIEAHSADGRVVGVIGSAAQPVVVPVVSARTQAEPALPGATPPASCAAKECPPGLKGCKQKGKAAIADACSGDEDCQSGLECSDSKCALIGGGSTEVPTYDPTTGGFGEGAAPEASNDAGDFRPTFVQLGFAVGLAYVQAGMEADRPSPPDRVFVDQFNAPGNFVADPTTANRMALFFPDAGGINDSKLTSWVPDADSMDSFSAIKGNCSADGKTSGPGADQTTLLPTKYCVRVKKPGFIANPALRLAIGRFVTPRISIAAIMRFQFSSGQGTLSSMLLGARGEYLLTQPKAKGFMVSGFAGLTFGQIQAQPKPDVGSATGAPFVKSGPLGVNLGATVRYRIMPNFGVFAAPELDIQLPAVLLNLDLTLAGVEAAF